MRYDALPSPGYIASGLELQKQCVKAISYVEVMADMKGGKTEQAKTLDTFFTACKTAIAGFIDTVLPTYSSGQIFRSTAPKTATLTFSEGLDPSVVPAATAFTLSQGGAVTSVEIDGGKVILVATTAFTTAAVTVSYTQPGTNGLRDTSGNLVATFTNQTVANNA